MLALFIIWAHFRAGKGEQFTLARIATALDKSDISSQFEKVKREADGTMGLGKADACHWEEKIIQEYGGRRLTLDKNDGSLSFVTPDAGRVF